MKRAIKIAAGVLGLLIVGLIVAVFVMASKGEAMLTGAGATPYPSLAASADPTVIAKGEYIVRTVGACSQCHGAYERMRPEGNTRDVPLTGGFKFDWGPLGTLWSANLTSDKDTGLGTLTDAQLARSLVTGVMHDGRISMYMRFGAELSNDDVVAVLSYLRTLPPEKSSGNKTAFTKLGYAMFSTVDIKPRSGPAPAGVEPTESPNLARGEYLAERVARCVECHSKLNMSTFTPDLPKAGGGDPNPSPGTDSDMIYVPPNLTSDATGITGKLTEDQFVARMKAGRTFPSSIMPWENLSRATDSDLRSIYLYLRSLPAVVNDVGPTYRKAD